MKFKLNENYDVDKYVEDAVDFLVSKEDWEDEDEYEDEVEEVMSAAQYFYEELEDAIENAVRSSIRDCDGTLKDYELMEDTLPKMINAIMPYIVNNCISDLGQLF